MTTPAIKRATRDFRKAVEAKNVPLADKHFEKLQKLISEAPIDENQLLPTITTILDYENLKRFGPNPTVIADPDKHIDLILAALDNGDGNKARELVVELQGSWYAGGPQPSETGMKKLVVSYRSKAWGN